MIYLYEDVYPEYAKALNEFLEPMKKDTTKDYTKDINYIKYIAYTAEEPYRSVFFIDL